MKGYEYATVTEGTIVKFKENKPWFNSGKRGVVIYKYDRWMLLEAIEPKNKDTWFINRGHSEVPIILTTYYETELDDF